MNRSSAARPSPSARSRVNPSSSRLSAGESPPWCTSAPRSAVPKPCSVGSTCAATSASRNRPIARSEEHTSELQSPCNLVCRLLLEKKKQKNDRSTATYHDVHDTHMRPGCLHTT